MPKKTKSVLREKTMQMVVVVPEALHKILVEESRRLGRSLVSVNRTILAHWAKQFRGYKPVEIIDGRTKAARASREFDL